MAITLVSAPANFYPYLDNAVYNNGKGKLCVGNSVVTDYNSSDINANKNVLFPVGFWGWGGNVLSGDKDVVFGKFTGKYRLLSQSVTDTKNLQNLYGGNGDYRMYEVLLYNPVTNVTNEGVTASYQVEFMDYRNDFSGNITNVSNYNSYLKAIEDDGNVTAVVWRDFQSNYFPHTGAEYNAFNLAQTGKRIVDWDVYFKDFNQKFIAVFKKVLSISRDVVWRGYDYVPVGYKKITLWPEEYGFGGPARIYGNSVKNIGVELEDFNFVETGICYSKTHSTLNIAVDSKAIRTEELIVGGAYHMNVMGLDLNSNYYMAGYALYANGDVVYSPTKQVQTKATKVLPSFIFAVAGTITNNSAKISCRVSENDYTVTEAGVCVATHVNPTTADDKETLETLPSGVLSLTGLASGTKHYVRQYAVYNGGTVYSELTPAVDLAFVGDHFYGVGTGEGLFPYASLTDYFTTAGAPVLGKVIGSIPTEIQLGETSVSLDAHITSEGGGTVTEAGMWLSTSPNPAVTGKKTVFTGAFVNGSLGKQFTTAYTGLIPGTLYYYAPYCKNVAGTFTSNDTTLRFRTYENTGVAITKATKLSSTSLNVEYNFTGIGKGEVEAIGLCYKQNGVPTVADAKTVDGTELGAYKTVIGFLQNNVNYNIRPYVTKTVNGGSTVTEYGDMITASMTDIAGTGTSANKKPTIVTLYDQGWKIETRNVQLSAKVTLMGASNIVRKGFVLAKVTNLLDPTPITGVDDPNSGNLGVDQSVEEVALNGKGNELGLMWKYINPPAGSYHYAAFAVNNDGTSYGEINFLIVPSLTDLGLDKPASAITTAVARNKNSAILWGIADYNWSSDIEERGFLYWKKSTPGTVLEKLVPEESTAFSGEVTGLLASTTYEFKAFVKETGESRVFGEVLEFTTLAAEIVEPTVILQSVTKNDTGFECLVETLTNEEFLLSKGVVWTRSDDGILNTIPTITSNRTPVGANGEDLQINVGPGWYMIAAYIETAQGMKVSFDGFKVVQWTQDTDDTDTDGNLITDTTQKFIPPKNPAPSVGQEWNFRSIARYIFNGEGWVRQRNSTINNLPVQDNGGGGSASPVPMQVSLDTVEYVEKDIAGNKIVETYFKSKMFLQTVDLMSITTEPELEFGGPNYFGKKYYNASDNKIYTAFDVMPGMFVWVEARDPETGVLYNFEGLSYLWNGTGLERVNINPAYEAMLGLFNNEIIEGVPESVNGYYKSYGDGAFVANSLYKSKKIEITEGATYIVSSDVSGGATALAVYYDGVTFISCEFVGVNTPGAIPYIRQELTVPVNATHIGLSRFGSEYAIIEKRGLLGVTPEYLDEHLADYEKNMNTGKKILWLGTSIPQQGAGTNNSYPHLVGNALNMTVYNESLGSSVVRASRYNGSLKGMYYIPALFSLSQTVAEKQSILDHWTTGLDVDGNIVEGGTYGWKDLMIGTPPANYTTLNTAEYILATSYEKKLVEKYLDTTHANFVGSPEIFVFDHGFNDLNPTTVYDDNLANAIAVPTPANSRSRFCGAMNYLIDIILTYNPRAKIVFIGHYENDRNTWVYQAQEVIAAYRKFPLLKLWEVSGISQLEITTTGNWTDAATWNNSGGAPTVRTMSEIWMYDDLHPASLATREYFAKLMIGFFKRI